MNFTCDSKPKLLRAIKDVSRAISSKTIQPIMANVKMRTDGDLVVFTGSDLDNWVEARVEAFIDKQGEISVNGKQLADIVSKLPEDCDVCFTLKKEALIITCGDSKFSMATIPASDYPSFPALPDKGCAVWSTGFTSGLKAVAFCADSLGIGSVLGGVHIVLDGTGWLRCEASNGTILGIYQKAVGASGVMDCILSAGRAVDVAAIVDAQDEQEMVVAADRCYLFVKTKSHTLACRLTAADFPKLSTLIPVDHNTLIGLKVETFLKSLDRVVTMADSRLRVLALEVDAVAKKCELAARTADVGEGQDKYPLECIEGPGLKLALNHLFFKQILNSLVTDGAWVHLTAPLKPVVITEDRKDTDVKYLIMPVQVK